MGIASEANVAKTGGAVITGISVKRLFGLYDYQIPMDLQSDGIGRVLILYGDNGSGKTTILRLLFHLLAPATQEGHKSYVARTKFSDVEIHLADGNVVRAFRDEESVIGSFRMQVRKGGSPTAECLWAADKDLRIPSRSPDSESQDDFLGKLAALGISLYLLSDDRTVRASVAESAMAGTAPSVLTQGMWHDPERWGIRSQGRPGDNVEPEQLSLILLEESIQRATAWLRYQAMSGSTQGESDVNAIYRRIVQSVAHPPTGRPKRGLTASQLGEKMSELETRNSGYVEFGLTPVFRADQLWQSVSGASRDRLAMVRRILVPYLDSVEARLRALEGVQKRVERLTGILNSFLVNKRVGFTVQRGFAITGSNGEQLSPQMLSSGERHLFLLFCNAVTVGAGEPSVFLIDEPEISLNVKWQRNLVTSLLSCVESSPVQFVLATHSMEILSQHMEEVATLASGSKQ